LESRLGHVLDIHEALALVLEHTPLSGEEVVPLEAALGRVLAEVIAADRDQPAFDRVTMDGIAFASRQWQRGVRRFRSVGTQGAGSNPLQLGDDPVCAEVMTGTSLPKGADTIVPVERITRDGDEIVVDEAYEAQPGQFIHGRGSDHPMGSTLLQPGMGIGPAEIAVLSTVGAVEVCVSQRPSVAVISTGSELVATDTQPQAFQIRSSNDRAIEAALQRRGIDTITRALLPDDPAVLCQEIATLHDRHDVVILSGGVSMGKYDYVPQVLAELDAEVIFHKVSQRPGLPMWFGKSAAGKPIFALPGNPVSTLVCLVRYVIPSLRAAMGQLELTEERVQLETTVEFKPNLTYLLPVNLVHDSIGQCLARPQPTNTSGDLAGLAGTDGFIELSRGPELYPRGFPARMFRW
jgi:molybdopterin molybdotransferase